MELGQQSIVNAMLVDPMAPEAQDGFHDQMHGPWCLRKVNVDEAEVTYHPCNINGILIGIVELQQ